MLPSLIPLVAALLFILPREAPAEVAVGTDGAGSPLRVLLLVSGAGKDRGETQPGFEMDELSQAWNTLQDNGVLLGIASPQGGTVEADRFNPRDPDNARFLADQRAQTSLANTMAISEVDPNVWDAVFVIGGKGAMIDLAIDKRVGALISGIHAAGGAVAAVCHGSAALASAYDEVGRPLVAGRRVTGFTNEEESQFAKRWRDRYPFLIEDELIEQGARWSEAPLMLPHIAIDDRLVTGQNPASTAAVADALLEQLGRIPRQRLQHRDELSLRLLARAYAGAIDEVAHALEQSPERYHPQLIGIVGHYQLMAAEGTSDIERALVGLRLAEPYMRAEPMIQLSLARAEWRLGRHSDARQRVAAVMRSHPDLHEAAALRKAWSQ